MFELIMTYCLVGQPCVNETVANFPQYDVGHAICEMAKPAIERGVRAKAPATARITFKCDIGHAGEPVEFQYEQPRPDLMNQVPQIINQVRGIFQ